MAMSIEDILGRGPVVPVVSVDRAEDAPPLARALIAGGIDVIEIALRTPAAIEAIRRIAGEVDAAVVGAGTVLTPEQMEEAAAAGARFLVSPGTTPALVAAASGQSAPYLPGAQTVSEAMHLWEAGYAVQKFFPAGPGGGAPALQAIAAVLPEVRFCPTGGVGAESAASYLALPNVIAVGGSWLTPADAIARQDWPAVTALARMAGRLAG